VAEFGVNTPIAIGFELIANRLQLRNNGRIVRACIGPIVEGRAGDPH